MRQNESMAHSWLTYELVRKRFDDAVLPLNQAQLRYRLVPNTLTVGEMALHVAGVEVSFAAQLYGRELEGLEARLKAAATDGAVNDKPFPFSEDEITPELVAEALAIGRRHAESLLKEPSADLLKKEIVSALGPIITGEGALARLAYHPGYHHGQVYMLTQAPGWPA